MPNYVMNRLKFAGSIDVGHFKRRFFSVYPDGEEYFDFGKIKQMPESIKNTVSGGLQDETIYVYKNCTCADEVPKYILERMIPWTVDDDSSYDCMIPLLSEKSQNIIESSKKFTDGETFSPNERYQILYDMGKVYVTNTEKYGYPTWYEWCIANWGTKWPGDDTHFDDTTGELVFKTAWNAPIPIYTELNKLGYRFTVKFADEAIGYNCGKIIAVDDTCVVSYLNDGSKEAIELGNEIW